MTGNTLTHFNARGEARMVDVGDKAVTARRAVASGSITMRRDTLDTIRRGDHGKGDVLGVARLAGIMAAKKTGDLIPLCHPLTLTRVAVDFDLDAARAAVVCTATAETRERTGVEMEAIVAVQNALATIYDMCKAVDRGMVIGEVRLEEKSGGRSGSWTRDPERDAQDPRP